MEFPKGLPDIFTRSKVLSSLIIRVWNLEQEQISQYQILIGSAQYAVTLGQYDVQYATNTLARFSQ